MIDTCEPIDNEVREEELEILLREMCKPDDYTAILEKLAPSIRYWADGYGKGFPHVSTDDLFQEGQIAAWKALKDGKWDPRQSSLRVYLGIRIRGAMSGYLRTNGPLNRCQLEKLKAGECAAQEVSTVSLDEVASTLNSPTDEELRADFIELVKALRPTISDSDLSLLVERFVNGNSAAEIARDRGVTRACISMQQAEVLSKIRQQAQLQGLTIIDF